MLTMLSTWLNKHRFDSRYHTCLDKYVMIRDAITRKRKLMEIMKITRCFHENVKTFHDNNKEERWKRIILPNTHFDVKFFCRWPVDQNRGSTRFKTTLNPSSPLPAEVHLLHNQARNSQHKESNVLSKLTLKIKAFFVYLFGPRMDFIK